MTFAQQLKQEALQQGLEQGLEQGEQLGEHRKAIAIAKNMLAEGMSLKAVQS